MTNPVKIALMFRIWTSHKYRTVCYILAQWKKRMRWRVSVSKTLMMIAELSGAIQAKDCCCCCWFFLFCFCFLFLRLLGLWGPCAPRRGRLPHSGGHPIGPGPKGSTGIRPVPGVEATMKRAVTWTADWKGTARFESSPPMKYSRGSKCNEWVFRIKNQFGMSLMQVSSNFLSSIGSPFRCRCWERKQLFAAKVCSTSRLLLRNGVATLEFGLFESRNSRIDETWIHRVETSYN